MKKKNSSLELKKKIHLVDGVDFSVAHCGFKKNGKDDVVLFKLKKRSRIFGFFTKSQFPGEPIKWNKSIKNFGYVSAILVNSGNANVFTGSEGRRSIQKIVKELSKLMKINSNEIYIASTGVIGEYFDHKKIISILPKLVNDLSSIPENWKRAANAIRTTDTFLKVESENFKIGKQKAFISGIAKGSGMIAPNMATMLAFIFSNTICDYSYQRKELNKIVEKTFNSITVDSDTSTSDMVLFVNVKSKSQIIIKKEEYLKEFLPKLENVSKQLATKIVKDGEGAKKFITINVVGANNNKNAKLIALSIANSPLVKTAIAGSDCNWGRLIMAMGKSKIKLEEKKISISFKNHKLITKGEISKNVNFQKLDEYFKTNEIEINIDLGIGKGFWTVWTCDFTKDYIKINADYRS